MQSAPCTIEAFSPSARIEGQSLLDEGSCRSLMEPSTSIKIADCLSLCCSNELEVYQPKQRKYLLKKGRNVMVHLGMIHVNTLGLHYA